MKKSNRGSTILEVLISVLIIAIVLVSLYTLLNQVRDDEVKSSTQSNYLINQAIYTKTLEEDFIDFGVKSVSPCSLSEANISNGVGGSNKCLKFVYNADHLEDNIAFLIVYKYNTKYTEKVCGTGIKACEPKWGIMYERGYYTKPGVTTSWVSTKTIINEYPDEVSVTETPYVYFTAAANANANNAASVVLPIVSSGNEHYDINVGFNYLGTKNNNVPSFICDNKTDDLICDCRYSTGNGCNDIWTKEGASITDISDSSLSVLTLDQRDIKGNLSTVKNSDGTTFTFDKNTFTYEVVVEKGVDSIAIVNDTKSIPNHTVGLQFKTSSSNSTAVLKNSTSKDYGGNNNSLIASEIDFGNNNKKIVVTAINGETTVYTINFKRVADTNADLKSLKVENATLSPSFKPNERNYSVTIPSSVNFLEIKCESESELASISGCSIMQNIESGTNFKEIVVTAEDGTQKVYSIVVHKNVSNDGRINDFGVKGGVLVKEGEKTYTLYIPKNGTEITINAIPNDSLAVVTGNTTRLVNEGDTINLTVKAEDDSVTYYTIHVALSEEDISYDHVSINVGELIKIDDYNYKIKLEPNQKEIILYGPFGQIPSETNHEYIKIQTSAEELEEGEETTSGEIYTFYFI